MDVPSTSLHTTQKHAHTVVTQARHDLPAASTARDDRQGHSILLLKKKKKEELNSTQRAERAQRVKAKVRKFNSSRVWDNR